MTMAVRVVYRTHIQNDLLKRVADVVWDLGVNVFQSGSGDSPIATSTPKKMQLSHQDVPQIFVRSRALAELLELANLCYRRLRVPGHWQAGPRKSA